MAVQWFLNSIPQNQTDGICIASTGNQRFLIFNNITEEYNGTTIQCMANFTSGIITSNSATLLVQGEENVTQSRS